jgi:hypothetical protein
MVALRMLPPAMRTARAIALRASELNLVGVELTAMQAFFFAAQPPGSDSRLNFHVAFRHSSSLLRLLLLAGRRSLRRLGLLLGRRIGAAAESIGVARSIACGIFIALTARAQHERSHRQHWR